MEKAVLFLRKYVIIATEFKVTVVEKLAVSGDGPSAGVDQRQYQQTRAGPVRTGYQADIQIRD